MTKNVLWTETHNSQELFTAKGVKKNPETQLTTFPELWSEEEEKK